MLYCNYSGVFFLVLRELLLTELNHEVCVLEGQHGRDDRRTVHNEASL